LTKKWKHDKVFFCQHVQRNLYKEGRKVENTAAGKNA